MSQFQPRQAVLLKADLESKKVFIVHDDASRILRLHFLEALVSFRPSLLIHFEAIRNDLEDIYERTFEAFLSHHGDGLPLYIVQIG